MNKQKLQELADYLRSGNLLAPFDMGTFFINKDKEGNIISACALGQALLLFPEIQKEDNNYQENVLHFFFPDITITNRVFDREKDNAALYIVHTLWKNVDNTPEGAAKRIEDVINGTIPKDWMELLMKSKDGVLIC